MDSTGAFGASGASGEFQLTTFIKKPQVILRFFGWLFSIVVFGCISSNSWVHDFNPATNNITCAFNKVDGACGYGTAIGVLAFLALMVFLVTDAMFDNLSNVMHRKYIVIADMGFSGLWTFLWFICFCYLTDMWRKAAEWIESPPVSKSGNQAVLAFSFFSIIVFAALTGLAVMKYRQGVATDFQSAYDSDIFGEGGGSHGGAPYQGSGESDYRQSPFADPLSGPKPPATAAGATGGGYQ